MRYSLEDARALLTAAGVFFGDLEDEDDDYNAAMKRTLNLNDVWGWACSDGEEVPDEEMPRVAELFFRYGWCGVLYWASERRKCRSQFHDVNRHIEFVRREEGLRAAEPSSSKRAYTNVQYMLGADGQATH